MLRTQHTFSKSDKLKLVAALVNKLQHEIKAHGLIRGLLGFMKSLVLQAYDQKGASERLVEMV